MKNIEKNLAMDIEEYSTKIDLNLSDRIRLDVPKILKKISSFEILLTGFILTIGEVFSLDSILVDIRRHGRDFFQENIDLTCTVGWLAIVFPILFNCDKRLSYRENIEHVQEKMAAIPGNGISYGLLRYLSADSDLRREMELFAKAEIAFNYHGNIDSVYNKNPIFSYLKKTIGNNTASEATRSHLINIDIMIINSRIDITWTYNKKFHKKSTIKNIQVKFCTILDKIVADILPILPPEIRP